MYWLFWERMPEILWNHTRIFIWGLILLVLWYKFLSYKNMDALVDFVIKEEEFDIEIRRWALQHLRNHADEYEQWVFMNELYRLLIEALVEKDTYLSGLPNANKEQIQQSTLLEQKEKDLLTTLYTPIFQSKDRDTERRINLVNDVEELVSWWKILSKPIVE